MLATNFLIITIISIFIFYIPITIFFQKGKTKKFAYKIGKIEDNRGNKYYKIFAKKENDSEFCVLDEISYFRNVKAINKRWRFNNAFETIEEAEKSLEDLLFILEIKKYSEKVEILNTNNHKEK